MQGQGEKIYKEFLPTAKYWLKELDYYGESQFKKITPASAWSIGQVYDHLINGTYSFHFKEIRNCLERKNGQPTGDKKLKGKLLFLWKSFPRVKIIGVNDTDYQPGQPDSPIKMKDELYRFIKQMHKLSQELDQTKDLDYKTMHPSLGMLTALEWYKLIEMHFRHHIRQKKRIDAVVRSFYKEDVEEV
ncbi:MAG TPA: DinB family protein [Cytophagaceae bacterium]